MKQQNLKLYNSSAEFAVKIYHSASRNSFQTFVSVQKSAKLIFRSTNPT